MGFIKPTPLPYDPLEWDQKPFPEKARLVCQAWAEQGYGAPVSAYIFYTLKIALYIGAWAFFCGLSPELGGIAEIGSWWLHPIAFQKAVLWSALFEVLGIGCGSGPLTGRYAPPFGGFLYFLRPGTIKQPLWQGAPLIGGTTRTLLDVGLYLALLVSLALALVHPAPGLDQLLLPIILLVALGVLDRTIFLAARGEHYWVLMVVFAFAGSWIAGSKAVFLALWFWAGFSKLNHHFAAVVCVMTSNSPFTRPTRLRRLVYRDYPDDLRPSRLAYLMGHAGTALEFSVPALLLLGDGGPVTAVGLALMFTLHGYITSNIPMGVPLEWNVIMVYGGCFLFGAHAQVSLGELGSPAVAGLLLFTLIAVPLIGNLAPSRVSFLPSMRYYAGNWAYSVWLFRGDSSRKLDRHLVKAAPRFHDQLALFYDRATAVGLLGKVIGFRLMHLHGRALHGLLPRAVGDLDALSEYEWVDGELVAGLALGWNFGDAHLHDHRLLAAIQERCGFEEGELRCVMVESQPLGQRTQAYRIFDARHGLVESGTVAIDDMLARKPWPEA